MAGSLDGRQVLITGASAGIGRAAAKAFAGRGARVIGLARGAEKLQALVEEIGPESISGLTADVADAASMDRATTDVLRRFGVPDVVVANAGVGLDAVFTETTDDALRSLFEVNVFGLVRTVRPFLPGMIERGSGRILIVSSIVGKRGVPHYSAYSASKFALHGLADSLRAELWSTPVTVGLICPSSTGTEFQDRLDRRGPAQKRMRPRVKSAESVARAIVRMSLSRRREVVLTPEAKLLILADLLAPRLVDYLLWRYLAHRS